MPKNIFFNYYILQSDKANKKKKTRNDINMNKNYVSAAENVPKYIEIDKVPKAF